LAVIFGKRVLYIENDKQGNGSKSFNRYSQEDKNTIARVMTEENIDVREIIKETAYPNLHMVSANMELLTANIKTMMDFGRQQQTRFRKAFERVQNDYDYCIIDNAPDINISIINALVMSDDVIIPFMIDEYSFDGFDILKEQIENTKEDFNGKLNFKGCLITQYQKDDINAQGIEILKNVHKVPVFNQCIRRTDKWRESSFARMPLAEYSSRSSSSQDYRKFVSEYLTMVEGNVPNLGTEKGGNNGI
jgi:chromosome partitioning protein